MNPQLMRERAARVRSIPLPAVLQALGAEADRDDKAKWHTAQGVISVTGMKFMNWTRASGGGGAIDLVIHLGGLDFKCAVAWLCRRFPDGTDVPYCSCTTAPAQFKLPPPAPEQSGVVTRYLSVQRRIRPILIESLIRCGDLYGDHHANAVFLLRGQQNVAVGAELRGTGHAVWRGMAPGSRKDLGYFSIRHPGGDGVILCESAIDAISCLIIHPAQWCISTAGARPDPAWLPALLGQGASVSCGFDADTTGDAMALAMIRQHPSVKRLRPAQHDWNDMLTSQS